MIKHSARFFILSIILFSYGATASPIHFDFRSAAIESIDGSQNLSYSENGLTIFLETKSGVFNRTHSAFGINASGSIDDSDEIDGDSIVESLIIRFDNVVNLISLNVSRLGNNDSGLLSIDDETLLNFSNSGTHNLFNLLLQSGETLILSHYSGNGFSFDSLTVETAEVDEPSPLLLLFSGLLFLIRRV